jgi:hypothetical protein
MPRAVDEEIDEQLVAVEGVIAHRDLPDRSVPQHDLSVPSAGLSVHPDL